MDRSKVKHFMYVPFVGLGLYGGFRGFKWFRNRIVIFKQFVVPSLLAQSNQNFVVWMSFTRELKGHKLIGELVAYMEKLGLKVVCTYSGICFYDDKHSLVEAKGRLAQSLHDSMPDLLTVIGDSDYVYMTIQPSDDCYYSGAVDEIQEALAGTAEAVGYSKGYIMNYNTLEIAEYNPETNPPFYTIKFTKAVFSDPFEHQKYTSLKKDVGKYPKGTPLPSHEYVPYCLDYTSVDKRGFLVGTHGVNISTTWNIPYKGEKVTGVLQNFFTEPVGPLKIKLGLFKRLPHKVQRKLRYWFGERLGFRL